MGAAFFFSSPQRHAAHENAHRRTARLEDSRGRQRGDGSQRRARLLVRRERRADAAIHPRRGGAVDRRRRDLLFAQPRPGRAARRHRPLRRLAASGRRQRPHRGHVVRRERADAGDAGAGRCRRRGGRRRPGLAEPHGATGDPRRARHALPVASFGRRGVAPRRRGPEARRDRSHPRAPRQFAQQPDRLDAHVRRTGNRCSRTVARPARGSSPTRSTSGSSSVPRVPPPAFSTSPAPAIV